MPDSYDLTQLDPHAFEHLVNLLALRVLGAGHTGFCPGSDGGRDGYYEGEASYPSEAERWSGCWYIQSKFHKPHLSKDPQKWLLTKIKEELQEFKNPESKRQWPNNWIIATNIDPSGTPETGAFDQAREIVSKARPELEKHFHIWGGRKILDLLALHPEISEYYKHFLTPGHILAEIYDQLTDARVEVKTILRFLILSQFSEQQYTKLEQAGSTADARPGIHDLFIDLPFRSNEHNLQGLVTKSLVHTAARCHRIDEEQPDTKQWRLWSRDPSRARVLFIKGGPGQGKSTIGQYFCQIQRAALILQKEIAKVPPKEKALATKIRKVAEKSGFWPSVPRIPISIELKEFAQWFGQRDKHDPRGILTYLAESVCAGVEQEVSVGTLKRILGSHSWLVVFDGLDEVPHDVKDAVALEVCRFVDNVALEVNADLLTLCTSRPQGYSGQFSDLEGSTIELSNLSADQALQCAKPVLELGRSESEAKKSLQILTSAVESPAVCELMTTPLQAHIMAVVVRDGERPPERRWKLFTNFYQVIKKREANRNLPDKRLAKLLREDEQLLKTVHNRLGFVLHARAESSKGAQTRLERAEFKTLVTDAALQMTEVEVDKTVEVLMQATTDRLVLVSTPDDGNHVRFDIRPLQEFFAAEFLYESVTVEELRGRIELIAGDAHWREVMHFLISALIENDRRTELTVAVEVLENLNEGDEDEEDLRLLKRRLGRGAILAARLLQEGVLEQDKRVRQQFRKCLEPLAASTEPELLRALMQVSQPNSQSWLYSFLVSCLHDKNLTESIGAVKVLTQVLPDDHGQVEEVSNFLLSSPLEYLSYVLISTSQRWYSRGHNPHNSIKKWFLKTILKILLSPKWSLLTDKAFSSAIENIFFNRKQFYDVVRELGLTESQIELFGILFQEKTHWTSETDYGIGVIAFSRNAQSISSSKFELLEEFDNTPGFLQLLYRILRFNETKNRSDFLKILEHCNEKEVNLVDTLCFHLTTPIPIDKNLSIPDQIKHLNSIDEKQFEVLLSSPQASFSLREQIYLVREALSVKPFSLNQWRALVEDHPEVALHLWNEEEIIRPSLVTPDKEEILNVLIDKVLRVPKILRIHSSLWGQFLDEFPSREPDLRDAFLRASLGVMPEETRPYKFYPFKLNLPLEAALLPHLVNSLVGNFRRFNPRVKFNQVDFINEVVSQMVSDSSLLMQISDDLNLAPSIRAAAVIMLLLYPEGSVDLESKRQLLVDFHNPKVGSWYIRAITTCLSLVTTEENPAAKWILSNLLGATRTDYESRQHLQRLLALWRESSYAPIQKTGVQEKWLSGIEHFVPQSPYG